MIIDGDGDVVVDVDVDVDVDVVVDGDGDVNETTWIALAVAVAVNVSVAVNDHVNVNVNDLRATRGRSALRYERRVERALRFPRAACSDSIVAAIRSGPAYADRLVAPASAS